MSDTATETYPAKLRNSARSTPVGSLLYVEPMPHDPLELRTLAEVEDATKLSRVEVLRAIADERLRVVWLGLNPAVPAAELDRFAGELELARGPA